MDIFAKPEPNNPFTLKSNLSDSFDFFPFSMNITVYNNYKILSSFSQLFLSPQDRYQLFLNSLNCSNDRLKRAMSLLDWSTGYKVSSFLERHRQAVLDVVDEKQLQKEYDSQTALYYLPKEKAEEFVVE